MNGPKMGHYLIEHILAPQGSQDIQATHEIINFMDEMPGGFLIYRMGGTEEIIYANRATRQMFQCENIEEFREMTGNSFRGMVHPEDLQAVQESIHAQIRENQEDLDYVEYRIVRKDGSTCWVEDYGHYVPSETSRDIFYVFLSDATEKRKLRDKEAQKLQNLMEAYDKQWTLINQEHLRRLEVIEGLSVTYETIFYVDLEKGLIMPYRLSARSGPIFDDTLQPLSFPAVMSNYIDNWVHPEDRGIVAKATDPDSIQKKLEDSKSYYSNYRVLNGEDAQYLQMQVVNVGHQDQASQIVMGFRRVDEEIQNEMKQKQLLAEALDNANRAIGAKSTFLSNMSHDIRTPLNAIFGFSTLAKRNYKSPEIVLEYLERIEASSRQLLDLINKVLELSQTESGDMRTVEEECDLCDILQEVYEFLLPQSVEKDMEFILDFSKVTHRGIYADEEKLRQLVMYLVNNAVTYTKPGGKVSITASELEELPNQFAVYQLVVEDNGIGISQEFIEHIFEPFSREKNTTLSGIHGIGLGLTIVKNIVDMMNGTIEVKSEQGVGTEFKVSFVFRLYSGKKVTQTIPELKNCRALVVDDDFNTCDSVSYMLGQIGLRAEWTLSGKKAVLRTRQANMRGDNYSVYIIDWLLPDINGVEVTRRIRKEMGDDVPIIVLTAYDWSDIEEEAREAGVTAFCSKPLFLSELRNCLSSVVHSGTDEQEEEDSEENKIRTGRILLAEDIDLNQEIATVILEDAGFTTEVAENGQIAVDMMKRSEPGYYQLILMDIQMPVMNGYDAAKAIRKLKNPDLASVPIIAMTANAFEEDKQEAIRCGMNGHIAKPIDIQHLLDTLDKILA